MSRAKGNESLSAEELKRKMYQSLQSAGVLNNLKGYLRQSVINELRGRYKKIGGVVDDSDVLAATMAKNAESSWDQKAIDNLIFHHLKQSRYLYSLSLFQQESGINQYDETLTEDLMLRLGASPDLLHGNKENERSFTKSRKTSTPVAASDDSKLLVWKILSRISSAQNLETKIDQNTMREAQQNPVRMSLADKLQAIDDEMDGTSREHRHDEIEHKKSVATLAGATRRAEEAADKRARVSFEQWKNTELASMRVKEWEKTKKEMLEKTRQLESDFAQRKEALLAREKNAIERLNNQKESWEKDLHHQRQILLQELEQIRVREKNLQEREQMMKDTETLKLRELDLMKSEVLGQHQDHPAAPEKRRDSAVSSCAESLRKSLTGRESRQLDEVLNHLDSRSNQVETLKRELASLRTELTDTKTQLRRDSTPERLSAPAYVSPREDGSSQSLRKRLDDLTRQLNDWKDQDKNRKDAAIESEISRWRSEVMKLSETKDRLDEKQRQLNEMTTRVSARLNETPRSPRLGTRRSRQPASTSLRILMDPQSGDLLGGLSIRDYDPVHAGRVRWADEMPYSVRTDLIRPHKSQRSPRRAANANESNLEVDTTNDTTASSNDLSTSHVRRDIGEKFKTLEKESEHLEQMYKRYIQSNYKHISPDTGAQSTRTAPAIDDHRPKPSRRARHAEQSSPMRKKRIPSPAGRGANVAHDLDESERPLDLKSLERKPVHPESTDSSFSERDDHKSPLIRSEVSDVILGKSNEWPPSAFSSGHTNEKPPFEQAERITVTTHSDGKNETRKIDPLQPSISDEEDKRETAPAVRSPDFSPTLTKKRHILPPLNSPSHLPPPRQREKSPIPARSELHFENPEALAEPHSRTSPLGDVFTPAVESQKDSISSFSSESSLPEKTTEVERQKSPFERPAMLQQKREELQLNFDQPDEVKTTSHHLMSPKLAVSPKNDAESPKHDSKLRLKLHDDEIQNILHSIDVESAHSIEGKPNPKLVDMLKQLEPDPIVTSLPETTRPHQEDSLSENCSLPGDKKRKLTRSSGEESASEQRNPPDEDYSDDDFVSSTDSKTASEVKTMSEIDPSSTSVPRIEDGSNGTQQSGEDKSEADVNWSNLQVDKSGELPQLESRHDTRRVEEEKNTVDVFADSQSDQSLEAASDGGKKSQSSEDDFW